MKSIKLSNNFFLIYDKIVKRIKLNFILNNLIINL